MPKIQFTKDHDGYLKGNVLTVDDGSAESLINLKVAQLYDGKSDVVALIRKPGVTPVAVVGTADYPDVPHDDDTDKGSVKDDAPKAAPPTPE
jgi:hypothetical protein